MKKINAIIFKEEGMYITQNPEIGATTQGRTIEESIRNQKGLLNYI
ncbi:MAG: hypothetical protein ACP5JU_00965 [Minisyncoccia bacterium]